MAIKKPTQADRIAAVEATLKDIELMVSALFEKQSEIKPVDKPAEAAPTFGSTMLTIAGIAAFLILGLCGLKYITAPAAEPVYNVHNEITNKTDNHCWILCKPGGTETR